MDHAFNSVRAWLTAAVVGLGVLAGTAAQAGDPRNMEIRDSPSALLGVETTLIAPHLSPYVSLSGGFANDELIGQDADGNPAHGPLNNRWTIKLAAGLSIFDRVELGLAMPVFAMSTRQIVTGFASAPTEQFSVGDLRFYAKGRLLGPDNDAVGFGLGLAAEIAFPTGDGTTFSGADGFSGTPWLVVDYRDPDAAYVSLNIGFRAQPVTTVGDLAIGNELRYSLGVEVPFHVYGLSALAEVHGGIGLGESPEDTSGIDGRKTPLEFNGALRWRHSSGLDVVAGFGGGVVGGYGAPDFRATLRLSWALDFTPGPTEGVHATKATVDGSKGSSGDGDSTANSATSGKGMKVPKKGENDLAVLAQRLPPLPKLDDERFDILSADDPDIDADGIPRDADACPKDAEDVDGFEDADGCPELDNDKDGVPDSRDKCPLKRETVNGVDDLDGCPDKGRAAVVRKGGKFELKEKIFFASNSDLIKEKSHPLLRQVAALLKASPEVNTIHIEGYTDSRGNKDANVDLSIRRSYAVSRFLVREGVAGGRLVPRGYGPLRPIASNRSSKGRAKNRRVEFVIKSEKDRSPAPDTGAKPPTDEKAKGAKP